MPETSCGNFITLACVFSYLCRLYVYMYYLCTRTLVNVNSISDSQMYVYCSTAVHFGVCAVHFGVYVNFFFWSNFCFCFCVVFVFTLPFELCTCPSGLFSAQQATYRIGNRVYYWVWLRSVIDPPPQPLGG